MGKKGRIVRDDAQKAERSRIWYLMGARGGKHRSRGRHRGQFGVWWL